MPFQHSLFRPTPAPSVNLPFGARSVGHYLVPPGYRDSIKIKHFVQVFWGITGVGALVINGMEKTLQPRQVALYFPGMRHEVYALGEIWEYCWWTMDGPLAESAATALGLAADVYDAGPAPLRLLNRLERLIRDQSQAAEREASASAYRLLTLAAAGRRSGVQDRCVEGAVKIIHAEWNRPELCVKQLAGRLGLHRSILSRRFASVLGLPPVAYLARLRAQNALSMLRQGGRSISEIALRCGYRDPDYFGRLIRRSTGLSPRAFREENSPKTQ